MATSVIDKRAGALLVALREERRLMPEEVPHAMLMAGIDRRYIPCSRTVRRAEAGRRVRLRVEFGLADFYGRGRHTIWAHARPAIQAEVAA